MSVFASTGVVGACCCLALAAIAALLKRRACPWWCFSLGMVLLAADSILGSLILAGPPAERTITWLELRLTAVAFLPGTWLLFSLCYSRGNYGEFLRKWWPVVALAYALPVGAALGFSWALVGDITYDQATGRIFVGFGPSGKLVNGTLLLGSILILMNFERTLRSAVGIMRWRIKYFVFGMALLFGAKFYTSSQDLLYSGIHAVSLQISEVAILCAAVLITYSLARTRLIESEVYPSHKVLQHSVTAVLAGGYLVCVGVLANLAVRWGGDRSFPIKALLLMVVVIGLGAVVLSDRVQQQVKLFVSRNFRRPVHDYRKAWSSFTQRTGTLIDRTEMGRAVVNLVSETFELLSVTLWVVGEHDRELVFVASTSLTGDKAENLPLGRSNVAELLEAVRVWPAPFDIDQCREKWVESLKGLTPDHFQKGGNRVCVPLVSAGETVGVITVSDRVNGRPFSVEDLDLLQCIGDQVAGSLRNIQLTERLMQHKELQAFQTMSAFFVHDLKNTASTLSLMVQNISVHFDDPAFREDCLRGLSRSVTRMNDLIRRLTTLRQELEIQKTETDLTEVVKAAMSDLDGLHGLTLVQDLAPVPKIPADPGLLHKVVTNLLLNAKEAVNDGGEIRILTKHQDGWVQVAVADNGCGMTSEFLRHSLFKPFQTTKKNGLGIGMFQSRAIVEAHQGRIEVESEPGQGTTFRVLLPVKA